MNERRARTDTANGFGKSFTPQPKRSNPMVAIEQMKKELAGDLTRMEQENKLEIMKMNGIVMALKEAMPIIEQIAGDPNQNLARLSALVLERGCDVAERSLEITVDPDA